SAPAPPKRLTVGLPLMVNVSEPPLPTRFSKLRKPRVLPLVYWQVAPTCQVAGALRPASVSGPAPPTSASMLVNPPVIEASVPAKPSPLPGAVSATWRADWEADQSRVSLPA